MLCYISGSPISNLTSKARYLIETDVGAAKD